MATKALIIPAAGSGKRMNRTTPKPFLMLGDETILGRTLNRFLAIDELCQILVVTSADYKQQAKTIIQQTVGNNIPWQCLLGGKERQDSVCAALEKVDDAALVLVHDAVRPFVSMQNIEQCCLEAEQTGGAVLGLPVKNTIKKVTFDYVVDHTPDREYMWEIQTPQVFQTAILKRAYEEAQKADYYGTDDASLVERLNVNIKVVQGQPQNIKITYPQDLLLAQIMVQNMEV